MDFESSSDAPDMAPIDPGAAQFETIGRIPVQVQVVLGTTTMSVSDLMAMGRGAIVSLDRRIGEPVELLVNGRTVARGDLQVLEGAEERFGISVTEIVGAVRGAAAGRRHDDRGR